MIYFANHFRCFVSRSHGAQIGFEKSLHLWGWPRWSSCLFFPSSGLRGMDHHTWLLVYNSNLPFISVSFQKQLKKQTPSHCSTSCGIHLSAGLCLKLILVLKGFGQRENSVYCKCLQHSAVNTAILCSFVCMCPLTTRRPMNISWRYSQGCLFILRLAL